MMDEIYGREGKRGRLVVLNSREREEEGRHKVAIVVGGVREEGEGRAVVLDGPNRGGGEKNNNSDRRWTRQKMRAGVEQVS